MKYGCNDDAKTLDDIKIRDHYVQLRWSKKCKASWTKSTASRVGPADKVYVESYQWVGVPPDHREKRKSYSTYVQDVSTYTSMVNSAYDARACQVDSLANNHKYCTSYE